VTTEVETRYGRIRGSETSGIRSFLGVRFGAPVSGVRRFLPPEPPEPWAGTRDALESGPSAPQISLPFFSWINAAARAPDEDCLSLNLWTPGLDGAKRPVLFWIHGGGFMVGSGSTPVYDGHDLARRGDVVVVTINYRLGALGYSHLGLVADGELEQSTNLGVRDQIAALEWVRDNIERFGGDPDNVTVFGQSAGGMSTAALLGAPRARSLVNRAILQSGAADHVLDAHEGREVASAFLRALGGPPTSPEALGRIPLDRLMAAQRDVMIQYSDLRKLMAFQPVVDGDLIPEQPIDAVRGGAASDIGLMIGATLDEWKLFGLMDGVTPMSEESVLDRFAEVMPELEGHPSPRRAYTEYRAALGTRRAASSPGSVWSAFQSARVFHYPAARLADAHEEGGGRHHAYLFTWRSPVMRRMLGACHALEIPFVFGSTQHALARPLTGLGTAPRRLSRRIQHAWIAFAHTGSPDHERLPAWPDYQSNGRATMIFGRECRLDHAPLDPERRLLEEWLPGRGSLVVGANADATRLAGG